MKFSMTTKRSLAAAALALPLVLAACGSDDNADTAAGSSTSTVTKSTETTQETTSSSTGESATGETETTAADGEQSSEPSAGNSDGTGNSSDTAAAGGAAADGAEGTNPPTLMNPFEAGAEVPAATMEPLQADNLGTEEDAAAIKASLDDVYAQSTFRGMTDALVNNTCQRVIDANGGPAAFDTSGLPDMSLAELGVDPAQNYVESVTDVRVDGDRASATVSVHTNNGVDTATQLFQREDGRWKMCN